MREKERTCVWAGDGQREKERERPTQCPTRSSPWGSVPQPMRLWPEQKPGVRAPRSEPPGVPHMNLVVTLLPSCVLPPTPSLWETFCNAAPWTSAHLQSIANGTAVSQEAVWGLGCSCVGETPSGLQHLQGDLPTRTLSGAAPTFPCSCRAHASCSWPQAFFQKFLLPVLPTPDLCVSRIPVRWRCACSMLFSHAP